MCTKTMGHTYCRPLHALCKIGQAHDFMTMYAYAPFLVMLAGNQTACLCMSGHMWYHRVSKEKVKAVPDKNLHCPLLVKVMMQDTENTRFASFWCCIVWHCYNTAVQLQQVRSTSSVYCNNQLSIDCQCTWQTLLSWLGLHGHM